MQCVLKVSSIDQMLVSRKIRVSISSIGIAFKYKYWHRGFLSFFFFNSLSLSSSGILYILKNWFGIEYLIFFLKYCISIGYQYRTLSSYRSEISANYSDRSS